MSAAVGHPDCAHSPPNAWLLESWFSPSAAGRVAHVKFAKLLPGTASVNRCTSTFAFGLHPHAKSFHNANPPPRTTDPLIGDVLNRRYVRYA